MISGHVAPLHSWCMTCTSNDELNFPEIAKSEPTQYFNSINIRLFEYHHVHLMFILKAL